MSSKKNGSTVARIASVVEDAIAKIQDDPVVKFQSTPRFSRDIPHELTIRFAIIDRKLAADAAAKAKVAAFDKIVNILIAETGFNIGRKGGEQ